MKIYFLFSIIKFVFIFSLSAQPKATVYQHNEVLMTPFWDFYSQNNLSAVSCGKGLTGIAGTNDISGITLNPASLELHSKYEIKAEYSYRSNVNWLTSLGFNDIYLKQNHPACGLLFGYKINDEFQTGFSYRNDINFKFDFGKIVITNEFGQEFGTVDFFQTFNTHSFSIPFVWKTKYFKAGIDLNYVLYRGFEMGFIPNSAVEKDLITTFGRFIPSVGIQIKPIPELSFGLTYSQGFDKKIVKDWKSIDTSIHNDTTLTHFPSKFGFGIELILFKEILKLEADYTFFNTSKLYASKDRNDIYFGLEYSINKNWFLRTGFFTLYDFRESSGNYIDSVGTYDQYFLTFGAGYRYKEFGFDLSFINSTIFSNSKVGHSKLNGSISYSF
jgi:long-subunit fatty acid transport protein